MSRTVDPRVADWRERCARGEVTKEEYAEIVMWLRAERRAAADLVDIKRAAKGRKSAGKRSKSGATAASDSSEDRGHGADDATGSLLDGIE